MEVSKFELLKAYITRDDDVLFKILQVNDDNIVKILSDDITHINKIPKEYLNCNIYAYFIYSNPSNIFYFIENNVTLQKYHYDIAIFKDPTIYNRLKEMGWVIDSNISDNTHALMKMVDRYKDQEPINTDKTTPIIHQIDHIQDKLYHSDHEKLLDAIREAKSINISDAVEVLKCTKNKARSILRNLIYDKKVKQYGRSRCTYYTIATSDHTDRIDENIVSKKCKIRIPEYSKIKTYEEEYEILKIHYAITNVIRIKNEKKRYIKLIDWIYDCVISGLNINANMYKNKIIKLKLNDTNAVDRSLNMNRTLSLINDNVPIFDRSLYIDEKRANDIINYAKQGLSVNKIHELLKGIKGCNINVIVDVLAKYDIDMLRRAMIRDKFILSKIIRIFIKYKDYITDVTDVTELYIDEYKNDSIDKTNETLLRKYVYRAQRCYEKYSKILN